MTLAADDAALVGLWLPGQQQLSSGPWMGAANVARAAEPAVQQIFAATSNWLDSYFAGGALPELPPIKLLGTAFRQEVWRLLLAIPYGATCTYGELAAQLAQRRGLARMSAQAVGGAVGHNPISVIVPCHRVVGANGKLTGYNGGIALKQWLLAHEQQLVR